MEQTNLEEAIDVVECMGDWEVAQYKQDTMEKRGTTRHCDQARNEEPCKVRERVTSSTGSNMQKTSQFDQGCLVWRTTLS